MNKSILYKLSVFLLIVPFMAFANNDPKGKHTKEKTIKKEYSVNSDALVQIDNSYGNLNVITWSENKVEIEVHITTNGNNEEAVQKKLDAITVDFNATSSLVSAKTRFGDNKSSWWKWKKNNVNMKINYTVKIPISNSVNLSNDYGNINLDKLEGHAKLSCDYGKIITKELLADNNNISFDYSSNCSFDYIKSGKINADYSSFTVEKTKDLDLNADYTKSIIEIAENVKYNCDYGGITVDKVNNITGNGDYLTTKIGDVYKNVSIQSDYGSIKINRLTENAGDVTIKSDYTGIKIGYDSNYNFNFEIDLEYASLKSEDDFNYTTKRIESTDKYYLGNSGTANSSNTINITSDYGSVTFYKN